MDPEREAAERLAWAEIHLIEDLHQLPRTLRRVAQATHRQARQQRKPLVYLLLVGLAFWLLVAGQHAQDRATRVPNIPPIELAPRCYSGPILCRTPRTPSTP